MTGLNEILQGAVEVAHLGLAELDTEGRYVAANSAFLSMLALREKELIGQHWGMTVHPDDRRRVQEAYDLARNSGHGYLEMRGCRGDSGIVYQALTVTAIRGADGALTGFHCMRHDISNYKRDQEALMLAVESAPSGLLILDVGGKIQSVNRAVEQLFGYSRRELAGCPVDTLLPARLRSLPLHPGETFARPGADSGLTNGGQDLCGLRKDGVEIPLQVYLNHIETAAGELILCTIIDIAERVRIQQQLESAKQAAEAANRAKSDFLARMSHEIRTPMNLIMGMNALLLESALDSRQRHHVEISYRNVRRLLRLINGILDLSKVEAGKLTLESSPFDLGHVLKECVATASSAVEQKGLLFETSIADDVPRYWIGDSERLQQVLLNLVGNSVKFTTSGKIGVRVSSESGEQGQPGLRFEVTDTGCGVPSDKRTVIFEAFQQAEGSMDRRYEGTGLGLAIAKTLVEMMSGRIWLAESSGSGAKFVFTVFFPLGTEVEVREKRSAARKAKVVRDLEPGTRILVAEDNAENQILLQAYLENLPLLLDFAANGVEAVEKRRNGAYDLVLMDIQMPVMDGYAATRAIRAWEQAAGTRSVPIVALTAHALTGALAESLDAGCDGHVTKPVERNDLVEAISKFAKRPAPAPLALPALPPAILARRPEFLANRRRDLVTMRFALAAGDFGSIQTIAHNCKGTGVGYGFPDITKVGSIIEQAAKLSAASDLERALEDFEHCVA